MTCGPHGNVPLSRVLPNGNGGIGSRTTRNPWGCLIEMPELDPAGYRWLRARTYERWRYLAVLDPDGRELCRLDMNTDPRIARTINDGTGEIEIEVSLRGDDPEFVYRLPVWIAATALYPTGEGDEYRSLVTYTHAALSEPIDGVDLEHRCHIPSATLAEVNLNG